MANAFTDTSALSNLVQAAYDRSVADPLRAAYLIRNLADKRPVQVDKPGSSVTFNIYTDLSAAITPLTESVDPDSVAVPQTSTVTLTPAEYGNPVLSTIRLQGVAFTSVDMGIASLVRNNMLDSLDTLAMTELRQGTNVLYQTDGTIGNISTTGPTNTVTSASRMNSKVFRRGVTELRARNAYPRVNDELFTALLHPRVAVDLREEVGNSNWRDPHAYNAGDNIWRGVTGVYEGAAVIETNRCYSATDGATSAKVYRSLLLGQEALAEGVVIEPHVVVGNVTDKLKRFLPIGWYGFLGWKRYREASLQRIETSASS